MSNELDLEIEMPARKLEGVPPMWTENYDQSFKDFYQNFGNL